MKETETCKFDRCDREQDTKYGYCGTCHRDECDSDTEHGPYCSHYCAPGPSGSDVSEADLRGECARDGCQNARAAGADLCSDCLGAKYGGYGPDYRDPSVPPTRDDSGLLDIDADA